VEVVAGSDHLHRRRRGSGRRPPAMLNGTAKIKAPACDKAAWMFLGLSMAGWNALVSLKLTDRLVLRWRACARRRR
jgi:disulfide bond formation protein DsbB